jgi:hypothetical protein
MLCQEGMHPVRVEFGCCGFGQTLASATNECRTVVE